MKNNKVIALALLVAMGLSPITGSVSLAEGEENKPVTEETQAKTEEKEDKETTGQEGDVNEENSDKDKNADDEDNDQDAGSKDEKGEDNVIILEEEESAKAIAERLAEKIRATRLYKLATEAEKESFENKVASYKEDDLKTTEETIAEDLAKESLGHTVVFAKPVRNRIRILSKLAEKNLEGNKELKDLKEKADAKVSSKETSLVDLEQIEKDLFAHVGTYEIGEKESEKIYEKAGYPDDILQELDLVLDYEELSLDLSAYLTDANEYSEDDLKKLEAFDKEDLVKNFKDAKAKLENLEIEDTTDSMKAANDAIKDYIIASHKLDNLVVKYNKKAEEAKENEKFEKALNDTEFEGKDAYKRTSKEYRDKYLAAKENLKKEKTDKNLKALEDIKAEIIKNSFTAKLAELRGAIDNPKEKNVSDEEFERIKKQYNDKLDAIDEDKSKTLDDLLDFEKEELPKYNKLVNPEKAGSTSTSTSSKTTKKPVKKTVTKKSNGKVRTGVESVLPIAGGVAVVAAIALFLTRKKK